MLIETTVYTSPESGRTANVRMWKLGDVFEVCIEVDNAAFVEDVFKSKTEAYAFLAKHWEDHGVKSHIPTFVNSNLLKVKYRNVRLDPISPPFLRVV